MASYCFAISEDEILLEQEEAFDLFENTQEKINPYSKQALKAIIEKEYNLNSAEGIFKEQLEYKFQKGIINDVGLSLKTRSTFTESINDDSSHLLFRPNIIDLGIKGKFKGEKEAFNTLFELAPEHENFFNKLVLDAWIETTRIPNNVLLFGNSRTPTGLEGGMSAFLIPFATRSQTARNLGNARKTGLRLKGEYKYFDYDIGGYSSDTYLSEFMPGVEGNIWLQAKPFANKKEKLGNLIVAAGYNTGVRNSKDFNVVSTALSYEHKKFWTRAEYQYANGSNGASGLSEKTRQGWNITAAYRLTKKLEILARYDEFDPNMNIKTLNQREYTAGINYYLLGQGLRFIFNYVFCQNQTPNPSHKIIFSTQILL